MVATNPIPRKPGPVSTPSPYAGPRDSDPLTEDELSLLLAIPRAARASPNATLFRLPRGTDPSLGWVDVTCAETYSTVSRLAARWNAKLSDTLRQRTQGRISEIGPGTTICMLMQTSYLSLFHFLAFWSLGCTVQHLSNTLDGSIIDTNLALMGARAQERLDGEMVELTETEYACRLVEIERQTTVEPTPPWPTPRRPTPAFILQSSGTTGMPKPLKFSLYFFTIRHKLNCENHLASARSPGSHSKTVYTHPSLMTSHPYWESFYQPFFVHLSTATPLAFVPAWNQVKLPLNEFISWVKGLDVGGIISSTYLIRELLVNGTHTQVLKDMYSIQIAGSTVDERTSELFEKSGIALTNNFGSSEFDRYLYAPSAPYNLLRPLPGLPRPLVNPLTERHSDGSREVELWYSAATSPYFAHVVAYGGAPLDVEPFPGEGPHHGKPAVNSKDIFCEVITGPSDEIAYVHLRRADDRMRLGSAGEMGLNASAYEARLRSMLEHLEECEGWAVDVLQLFGSALPATSLVIQLRSSAQGGLSPRGQLKEVGPELVLALSRCVETVNAEMDLTTLRVNPKKRMLIIVAEGGVYGPGAERVLVSNGTKATPKLMVTHKHTLRSAAIDLNASEYEARFWSLVDHAGGYPGLRIDVVQVFGSNMPAAALVVQLARQQEYEPPSWPIPKALGSDVFELFARWAEEANVKMELGVLRVNPEKRLLVITTEGDVYGPGADRLAEANADKARPGLLVTHKHTIRRWANVQSFKAWLDGLDYSDS